MDMHFCRKIFASHLRQSGIEAEIVDLLQGRVPNFVFARHYFTPSLGYTAKVLQALNQLKSQSSTKIVADP
jgi:intergrase/recombinase